MDMEQKEALWTRNFMFICAVHFFLFCGFQMFPAALSPYLKSLGAEDAVLGWVVGVGTLSTVLMRPFAGAALDRFGRKWVFLAGIIVMMLASAGHLIPSVMAIFLMRGILGAGFGIANTGSNTIATDNMPRTRFGEAMGFFSLFAALAMAVSPALALSMPSWAMIGTATAFIAVSFALAFALKYKTVEKNATQKPKRGMFEKSAVLPACILCCVTTTYGGIVTFIALYAAERGIHNIGGYFTMYAAMLVITRPAVGKFLDRRGFSAAVLPGLIAISAALAVLSQAEGLTAFLLSAAFFGLGQGAVQTSAQTMAVAYAPKEKIGAANATYFIGFDAGVGFGAVIAGLISQFTGYGAMYLINVIFPVMAAALYFIYLAIRKKEQQRNATA